MTYSGEASLSHLRHLIHGEVENDRLDVFVNLLRRVQLAQVGQLAAGWTYKFLFSVPWLKHKEMGGV